MATNNWIGRALPIAQITAATPASVTSGDVFTLTIGGVSVAFTASASTVANVTAGLTTAWNASTHPYFAAVTATDMTTYVKLTADTAGVPFVVTGGATGGSPTNVISPVTASSGPNDWSTAANWSTGAVPTTGDTVYVENSAVSIMWGLNQSSVTLASLFIGQSYTGLIGLDTRSFAKNSTPSLNDFTVAEYRDSYLRISATLWQSGYFYGSGSANGSGRIKLNFGIAQFTGTVFNTGANPTETNLTPMRILGTHASNVLNVIGGSVSVASDMGGEVSTVVTANVSVAGSLAFSSGCTLTTYNQSAGTGIVGCACTTANMQAGSLTVRGTGAVTTVNHGGGTIRWDATGAVTTLNINTSASSITYNGTGTITTVNNRGTLDCSQDTRAKTITNLYIYAGSTTNLDNGTPSSITLTNGAQLQHCGVEDVTVKFGKHIKLVQTFL